jgi:hypothetical protein
MSFGRLLSEAKDEAECERKVPSTYHILSLLVLHLSDQSFARLKETNLLDNLPRTSLVHKVAVYLEELDDDEGGDIASHSLCN